MGHGHIHSYFAAWGYWMKENTEEDLYSKCHICLPKPGDIFHFYLSIKQDIETLSVFNFYTFFNEAIILLCLVDTLGME